MDFKAYFKDYISFPQEKKQKILMIVFVSIVFVIIIVLYIGSSGFNIFSKSPPISTSTDERLYLIDKTVKEIDFDNEFLNYLEDLEIYGERPSGEIEKGTTNPFLEN